MTTKPAELLQEATRLLSDEYDVIGPVEEHGGHYACVFLRSAGGNGVRLKIELTKGAPESDDVHAQGFIWWPATGSWSRYHGRLLGITSDELVLIDRLCTFIQLGYNLGWDAQ